MKILHTISGLSINSGGPSLSVWSLVNGLQQLKVYADIVTLDPGEENNNLIAENHWIHVIPEAKNKRFAYSNQLQKFLYNRSPDIYHGHALWQYPVHAMAKVARSKNKPYVISPRGMLYPEALRKSAWYKKLAMRLFQLKDLQKASVIHATCQQELIHIRNLGLTNPVAVIPNSIDIKIPAKIQIIQKTKKRVGFLGRFAPIKNIESLINAWALSGKDNTDWELVLIGDGDNKYKTLLMELIEKHQIKNIIFTGFLSDKEKERELRSLDFLVLPSKSENFGMVVPEALIRQIPVIASKGTPWEELNTKNAGWWIDTGVEPLVKTLKKAIALPDAERQEMGRNGRNLVEEKYSIESVAEQMLSLYTWIIEGGEKPKFVN